MEFGSHVLEPCSDHVWTSSLSLWSPLRFRKEEARGAEKQCVQVGSREARRQSCWGRAGERACPGGLAREPPGTEAMVAGT